MKITLSLLDRYIDIAQFGKGISVVDEISQLLLRAGIEVDAIEIIQPLFSDVKVVQVTKTAKHPQSDKLTCAEIFDGQDYHNIVCGAPNCKEGLVTAFASIGSKLYVEGLARPPLVVGEATIRGVVSPGMLLSEKELGIGGDHEGIVSLDGVPLGTDVSELVRDTVFELGLTPNLGYAMSVYGIARELSIQSGVALKPLHWTTCTEILKPCDTYQMVIEDTRVCSQYNALVVDTLTVGLSPFYIRRWLSLCGIKPINSVVDITNLVALELGQPMHAFDRAKISGNTLFVKSAAADEREVALLDGQTRIIPDGVVTITDNQHVLALGGIIGGVDSSVSADTTSCLIESAYFQPAAIRKGSKLVQISTESSRRFERGCDPNGSAHALEYAAFLFQKLCPSASFLGCIMAGEAHFEGKNITCRRSRASKIIGYSISLDDMDLCFRRCGWNYQSDGVDLFEVQVPAYRHDISEEIDLIEEIAKILGYLRDERKETAYSGSRRPHHPIFLAEQLVRRALSSIGLQECVTCNLISPQMVDVVLKHPIQPENLVHMLNPLSAEQSVLRPSLLPGLLKVVQHNINQRNLHMQCFEVGNIHLKESSGAFEEQLVMGIIITGNHRLDGALAEDRSFDFYDLKGVVEDVFSCLHISKTTCNASSISVFHPGRQAAIYCKQHTTSLGMLGEVHPTVLRKLGIDQRVYFAEFDVQELMHLRERPHQMEPLPLFPSSERDWTITVDENITWGAIEESINQAKSALLEAFSLVTVYRSEKLGLGKKNVTINFLYRRLDTTISQEEVDREHAKMVGQVETLFANRD